MKPHDKERLLNEMIGGEQLEAFRQATLECGLSALRRRRRYKRIVKVSGLACVPLLATLFVLSRSNMSPPKNAATSTAPIILAASDAARTRGVKIISDEELFALFPNRAMALVGKPGHQQLLFLDRPQPAAEPVTQ